MESWEGDRDRGFAVPPLSVKIHRKSGDREAEEGRMCVCVCVCV